MIEPTLNSAIT